MKSPGLVLVEPHNHLIEFDDRTIIPRGDCYPQEPLGASCQLGAADAIGCIEIEDLLLIAACSSSLVSRIIYGRKP